MGLYVEEKGGIYLKLAEKSEGRKGEIFVNFLDFTKFSAGLKSVHESGFSTEECFSLSDGQDCSIFHMGEEIRIRKKARNPIESGLVVVSIGEVEQIVETIKEDARCDEGLDPVVTSIRRKREDFWMERLNSIFPYGLNNRHGKNQDQADMDEPVRKVFRRRKIKKNRRNLRRFRNRSTLEGSKTYEDLTRGFTATQNDIPLMNERITKACNVVSQMKKEDVKKLGFLALEDMKSDNLIPIRLLNIIYDLTKWKLYRAKDVVKPKKQIGIPFVVQYTNHWIEMINLNGIINSPELIDTIPRGARKKLPTAVMKLKPTIRGRIFNYKDTVSDYTVGQEEDLNCDCDDSPYKDAHHGHVITGNLQIVEDRRLRDLLRKGPNHREKEPLHWSLARKTLVQDIDTFITKWSGKTGRAESCYAEWKTKLMEKIDDKYKELKNKIQVQPVKKVLKIPECSKELEDLQRKYVLVPIDKAANNIGFVCKKYYLSVIAQELQTDTYDIFREGKQEVIDHLVNENQLKAGILVEGKYKNLPQIHAIVKMHKTPVKFRFIIGDRFGVQKMVAKKMVRILQLIQMVTKRYCDKIHLFTGINRYWVIDNSATVMEDIRRINHRGQARSMEEFDFSTLYTKISQEDLKEKLMCITEKAFKGGQNQYIRVCDSRASWTNNTNGSYCVSKDMIRNMLELIVDNAYFSFGDKVYRQIIGIPMGIDPAPQMANLYLHYYEADFMEHLSVEHYSQARKFNHTRRFIDDLNTFNNEGLLGKFNSEGKIYPGEMILNKENEGNQKGTFLELDMEIKGKEVEVKLYDKREAFGFEIVNFPHMDSNIPRSMAYGVFSSQMIRFARVCLLKDDFLYRLKSLVSKLMRKGYLVERLKKTAWRCTERHRWILEKCTHAEIKQIFNLTG